MEVAAAPRPMRGEEGGGVGGSRRRLQRHRAAPGFFGQPRGFSAELTLGSAALEVALVATKLPRNSVLPQTLTQKLVVTKRGKGNHFINGV